MSTETKKYVVTAGCVTVTTGFDGNKPLVARLVQNQIIEADPEHESIKTLLGLKSIEEVVKGARIAKATVRKVVLAAGARVDDPALDPRTDILPIVPQGGALPVED